MPRKSLQPSLAFDENDEQSIQQSSATINHEKRKRIRAKRNRRKVLVENSQFKDESENDLELNPKYNNQSEKQENDSGDTLNVWSDKKTDATKNKKRITRSLNRPSNSDDTDSSDSVGTKLSPNQKPISPDEENTKLSPEQLHRSSNSSSHEIEFNFTRKSDIHNDTIENISNIVDESVIVISSQDENESFGTSKKSIKKNKKKSSLIKDQSLDLDSLEASVISIPSQDSKETFDTLSENSIVKIEKKNQSFDNSNTVKDESVVSVSTKLTVPKLVDYSLSSADTMSDKKFSESMLSDLSQDENKQNSTSVKTPEKLIKESTFILETPSTGRKSTRRTRSVGFDVNKKLPEHFSSLEKDTPPKDTRKSSPFSKKLVTSNKTPLRKSVPSTEEKKNSVTKSALKNTAGKSVNKTLSPKNTPTAVISSINTQSKVVKSLNFDKTPVRRSTRSTTVHFSDSSEQTSTPKKKILCTPYQKINLKDFKTPVTPRMSDKSSLNKYRCTPYWSRNNVEESPSFNVTLRRRSKSNDDLSTTTKKRNVTFGENITIIGDVLSPRRFRKSTPDRNVPNVSKPRSVMGDAMSPWNSRRTPNKNVASTSKPRSVRKEMPDFAAIHKKAFEQMESLQDQVQRKTERAQLLLSSSKKNKKMLPSAIPRRIETSKTSTQKSSTDSVFSATGFGNTFGIGNMNKLQKEPFKEKETAKSVAKKLPPSGRQLKEKNREYVKGVRSNRRFDLLMQSRFK